MIAAASRLAAIPMEGESPAAVETRRARDLLQTAMVQQQAYSYSRDRIHSTPRPSRSYSRHIDEPAVSSSARNRDAPRGPDPVRGGANAQDVVNNGARREAELAAQDRQLTPVRPVASVERKALLSALGGCPASSRLCAMYGCPRISRAPVRCLITPLMCLPSHGLRVMRWLWRC